MTENFQEPTVSFKSDFSLLRDMDDSKGTLLYLGRSSYQYLVDDIVRGTWGYGSQFVHEIKPEAPSLLEEIVGVVFVGPQTAKRGSAVFETRNMYSRYLLKIHGAGLKVAAVMNPGDDLPRNNKWIDCFLRTSRGEQSLVSIGQDLQKYFDRELARQDQPLPEHQ